MTKILFENDWLALHEKDGYTFLHENRCDNLVAICVFTKKDNKILKIYGRFENNPAHVKSSDDFELCSITGGIDHDKTAETMALEELMEEAGIMAQEEDLIDLGQVKPYKAADTIVYLFALDMTGKESEIHKDLATGDGSNGEEKCYCEWVDYEDVVECEDSLMHSMLLRLNSWR